MYLKQLDIVGFKSFADKTRLTFDPGLIAIVGPNGCGKSNVSDAIRWVLGEQRPTALRCSKLVDVVFNGTDTRKPLGLAEVSITFTDCEKELGTDYHEVTITRRVYRDGSGEYENQQMTPVLTALVVGANLTDDVQHIRGARV
jgi:chromosome segregation protein